MRSLCFVISIACACFVTACVGERRGDRRGSGGTDGQDATAGARDAGSALPGRDAQTLGAEDAGGGVRVDAGHDAGPVAACGDGVCGSRESCASCSSDCGSCCGNGSCEASLGETCSSCARDCGSCCRTTGAICSTAADCCGGYCLAGTCSATSCLSDGQRCGGSYDCCSGTCAGGACVPAPTCVPSGGLCGTTSECCSDARFCRHYFSQPTRCQASCGAPSNHCTTNADCCSFSCRYSESAGWNICD